jgi:murein DD-endopeptidase MepM/ murein hydrolase activator NlpD
VYVKAGQWVNAEHAVGEVGSTGRSTGPHLHYEVLYAGVNMDPMVFIKAK